MPASAATSASASASKNSATIPFKPRTAQKLILKTLSQSRFTTAICHRRLGKTYLAVYWLITECLAQASPVSPTAGNPAKAVAANKMANVLSKARPAPTPLLPDFRAFYFGSSQKAAKQVAWLYFKKLLAPLTALNLVTFRETSLEVMFNFGLPQGDPVITLAGSENIESYRGIYIDRIVADELASWWNPRYGWFEVLRPAMADRLASALIIGTVKGLDLLFDFYVRGISKNPDDQLFNAIKLPASLTGVIDPAELEELKRSMTPDAYAREMECDFFAESPDVLISPSEVDAARKRQLTPSQLAYNSQAPVTLSCDPGRTVDPSAIYMKRGLSVTRLFSGPTPDHMKLADKLSSLINTHSPTTVFIDAGQGQGVIDRLHQLGHGSIVAEIRFNSTSPEPAAVNMRAAMYLRLKRFLSKGRIPDDKQLIKELVNQELVDDPNNRIKLAPKRVITGRIGNSPNDSDAVALLFAEEDTTEDPEVLKQQAISQFLAASGFDTNSQGTYDPLTYLTTLED